jgi:chemotaxis methyl-accepting protein methylase
LEQVRPYFDENISENMKQRISFQALDFMKDDFPKVDCIILSHVLMDWNLDVKKLLIKKAFDALPSGGVIIACEEIIDDERSNKLASLLLSMHMILIT